MKLKKKNMSRESGHCHACARDIANVELECDPCGAVFCTEECYETAKEDHWSHCQTIGTLLGGLGAVDQTRGCFSGLDAAKVVECIKVMPFNTIVHALGAVREHRPMSVEQKTKLWKTVLEEVYDFEFLRQNLAGRRSPDEIFLSLNVEDRSSTFGSPKNLVVFQRHTWEVGYWESAAVQLARVLRPLVGNANMVAAQAWQWLKAGPVVKHINFATECGLPGKQKAVTMEPELVDSTRSVGVYTDEIPRQGLDGNSQILAKTRPMDAMVFLSAANKERNAIRVKRRKEIAGGSVSLFWTYPRQKDAYPRIARTKLMYVPVLQYAVMVVTDKGGEAKPYIIGVRYGRDRSVVDYTETEIVDAARARRIAEAIQISELPGVIGTIKAFQVKLKQVRLETTGMNPWLQILRYYFEYLANLSQWNRLSYEQEKDMHDDYWRAVASCSDKGKVDLRSGSKGYTSLTRHDSIPMHLPGFLLEPAVRELRASGNIMLPSRFFEPAAMHKLRSLELGPGKAGDVSVLLWNKAYYRKGEASNAIPLRRFVYHSRSGRYAPSTLSRATQLESLTLTNCRIAFSDFRNFADGFGKSLRFLSLSRVEFVMDKMRGPRIKSLLDAFLVLFPRLQQLELIGAGATNTTMRVLDDNHRELRELTLRSMSQVTEIPASLRDRMIRLTAGKISSIGVVDATQFRLVEIEDSGIVTEERPEKGKEEYDGDHDVLFFGSSLVKTRRLKGRGTRGMVEQSRLDAEGDLRGMRVANTAQSPNYKIHIHSTGTNNSDDIAVSYSTETVNVFGVPVKDQKGGEHVSLFIKCKSGTVKAATKEIDGDMIYAIAARSQSLFRPTAEVRQYGDKLVGSLYTVNEISGHFSPMMSSDPNGYIIRVARGDGHDVATTALLIPSALPDADTLQDVRLGANEKSEVVGRIGLSKPVPLGIAKAGIRLRLLMYYDMHSKVTVVVGIHALFPAKSTIDQFDVFDGNSRSTNGTIEIPLLLSNPPVPFDWFRGHLKSGVSERTAKRMQKLWLNAVVDCVGIQLDVADSVRWGQTEGVAIRSTVTWDSQSLSGRRVYHWTAKPRFASLDGGWQKLVDRFNAGASDSKATMRLLAGELENETRVLGVGIDPITAIAFEVGAQKDKTRSKLRTGMGIVPSEPGVTRSTAWYPSSSNGVGQLVQSSDLKRVDPFLGEKLPISYCNVRQTTAPGSTSGSLVPVEIDVSMTLADIMTIVGARVAHAITGPNGNTARTVFSIYTNEDISYFAGDANLVFLRELVEIVGEIMELETRRKIAAGNAQVTVEADAAERDYRERNYQRLILFYFYGLCVDHVHNKLQRRGTVQSAAVASAKDALRPAMGWIVERIPFVDPQKERGELHPQMGQLLESDSLYADAYGTAPMDLDDGQNDGLEEMPVLESMAHDNFDDAF